MDPNGLLGQEPAAPPSEMDPNGFASRQIHREALAALAFFRQAAEAERASLDLVTGVAAFLRRAQHDPAFPFAGPIGE